MKTDAPAGAMNAALISSSLTHWDSRWLRDQYHRLWELCCFDHSAFRDPWMIKSLLPMAIRVLCSETG